MSLAAITLAFEAVVALLLGLTIFYATRLNSRLVQLRQREAEMQNLIATFDQATLRAEDSIGRLKAVSAEIETALHIRIDRAQALRDELAFIIDFGDSLASRVERDRTGGQAGNEQGSEPSATPSAEPARPAAAPKTPARSVGPGAVKASSRAERELAHALISSRGRS